MEASESLIVAPREYHCITLTHLEEKLAHRCVYIGGFAYHACGEAGTWKGGLLGADLNNHGPANFRGKNGTIDPGSESSSCSILHLNLFKSLSLGTPACYQLVCISRQSSKGSIYLFTVPQLS